MRLAGSLSCAVQCVEKLMKIPGFMELQIVEPCVNQHVPQQVNSHGEFSCFG